MRQVPVDNRAGLAAADSAPLRDALSRHATLQDVLDWSRAQAPPAELVDVVMQDEYTHDVLYDLGRGLFAVYDTT